MKVRACAKNAPMQDYGTIVSHRIASFWNESSKMVVTCRTDGERSPKLGCKLTHETYF